MELTIKFLKEVAMPEIKANARNINKGLIPRFHKDISDKFFGGTKQSLAKVCSELATKDILHKAFVKFKPSADDKLSEPDENGRSVVTEGPHNGMKVGKDGKLSTPIYWFKDDADIPTWAKNAGVNQYRVGEEWFKANETHSSPVLIPEIAEEVPF